MLFGEAEAYKFARKISPACTNKIVNTSRKNDTTTMSLNPYTDTDTDILNPKEIQTVMLQAYYLSFKVNDVCRFKRNLLHIKKKNMAVN